MALDKEQFAKYINYYKQNPSRIFLHLMIVLLAVRIAVFLMEANFTPPETVPIQSVELQPYISAEDPNYQKVINMTKRWPEFEEREEYYKLAEINMFDPKLVLDAQQREERANQRYQEAVAAFGRGDLQRARELVDEVLQLSPQHNRARQLLEQIEQRQAAPG